MTVYKGYMKIIKRNLGLILLYLVIFLAITIIFQVAAGKNAVTSYQAESINIAVVDEDGGELAQALWDYLGQFHHVKGMEDDLALMQEELFYRNVEYIVRIPGHFLENCVENGGKLSVTKVPGSFTAFYVDQQINSFLNNARSYAAAGFTEKEIVEALKESKTVQVETLDAEKIAEQASGYSFFFQYLPFLFLSVMCYVIGNVLFAFQKGDLPKRMHASAVSERRQSLEGLLAVGTLGLGLWGIIVVSAMFLYGKALWRSPGLSYYLLNSLLMLLEAISIAYLVGMLIKGKAVHNMLSGIVNVLTLGMCFLCGVFVPLELLNKNVKIVAQFLPVYWYETVNKQLTDFSAVTGEVKQTVMLGMGMQGLFAAVFVCMALAVAKQRRAG